MQSVSVYNTPLDCTTNTNVIALLTEWDEFKDYDWQKIYNKMNKPTYIFDGRNIYVGLFILLYIFCQS
jgi:UDPglucose 6-dehydrogenase